MKILPFFVVLWLLTIHGATSQSALINNINLINVETGKVQVKNNVLIEGGKIAIVSSKEIKNVKKLDTIIDGTAKFLLPGMIDSHIHFFQSGNLFTRPDAFDGTSIKPYEEEVQFAKELVKDSFKRYLRLGITSVMDVGGPFYNFTIRDSIAAHTISPNVFVTGPLFSSYQPKIFASLEDKPIEKISTKQDATSLFNKMLSYDPDFIKIWYIVSRGETAEKNYPIVAHIAELTHKHKLKLAVHATDLHTAKLAIKAGADILVHSVRDTLVDKEFITQLKEKKVTYIPTLIISKNYGKAFLGVPDNHKQDLYFANPEVYSSLTFMQKDMDEIPKGLKWIRANRETYFKRKQAEDSVMLKNLYTLTAHDINVATGTDAGNIGTVHASSYIQEIEAMKKSGISNLDIIQASTIQAAKGFGLDDKIGSIAKGKVADLLILDKNPLDDIQHLNTIHEVLKDGVVVKINELIKESPEQIVQRQVNAYNARDLDAFMDMYADDIKIYNFPNEISMEGKSAMRKRFGSMFQRIPNLYCEIKNRIVLGNKVVDREYVRFGKKYSNVIAIYEITEGKISKVTFLR